VTVLRFGITRQPSEINSYYCGRYPGKIWKKEANEDHIEDSTDEGELQDKGQGDSRVEKQKNRESDEESNARLCKEDREKISAVVPTWAGYVFMDEARKMMHEVTRRDDMQALIEKEDPKI
jgi:hypothetical protein